MTPRKLQPALLGGAFIGVLSALPFVSAGNCCCCLWIVAGGALAAWLMQQAHPAPVSPGDGFLVGLFAGLVGAFVYLLVALPITLALGPILEGVGRGMIDASGEMPEEVREMMERMGTVGPIYFWFAVMLTVGSLVAGLGGLLGAVLLRKPEPPAPPAPGMPPTLATWTTGEPPSGGPPPMPPPPTPPPPPAPSV